MKETEERLDELEDDIEITQAARTAKQSEQVDFTRVSVVEPTTTGWDERDREGSDESFLSLLTDDSVYEVFPSANSNENENENGIGDEIRIRDVDPPDWRPMTPPTRRRIGVEGTLFDESCMPVDWSFIQRTPQRPSSSPEDVTRRPPSPPVEVETRSDEVAYLRDEVQYPSGRAR